MSLVAAGLDTLDVGLGPFPVTPLDLCLWIAAGLGAVWALGPLLMDFLGLSRLRFEAQHAPRVVEPTCDDPEYRQRFTQLRSLGFSPLGIVREKAWCHFGQWRKVFEVRFLATADRACFASLYRLHPGEPLRVSLETFTTQRGLVRTVMPGVGEPHLDDTYMRTEHQGLEVPELLAQHQEDVEQFTARTGLEVVAQTFEGRAAIDEEHEKRHMSKIGSASFLPFFLLPTFGAYFLLDRFPEWVPAPRSYPLALCLGSLAYFLMMHVALPMLVRQSCVKNHTEPHTEQAGAG
jgi:hypothetical protein